MNIYNFREDLYTFIEELKKEEPLTEDSFLKFKPSPFYANVNQIMIDILKKEHLSLYLLSKQSKLAIDKALFKHNYTPPEIIDVEIYPFDLWALVKSFDNYDRLVTVERKKNALNLVGGIPLRPLRHHFRLAVIYKKHAMLKNETEVSPNMKLHKMNAHDLAPFEKAMEKIMIELR